MEAITRLHTVPGLAMAAGLLLLAVVAATLAVLDRAPNGWPEGIRRVLLGLLVAEAALGLVLALRGSAPAEGIHWVYGAAVIAVLLAPGALRPDLAPRSRSTALAVGAALAALLTWRLWGSG